MAQIEETIELVRGSTAIDLTDLVLHHVITFDGFGMPPLRRLSERGPMQDGDTDIGYRLDPRILRLQVQLYGLNNSGLHDRRRALLGALRPGAASDPVKLRYTHPSGLTRQIDAHLSGGMTFNGGGRLRASMPEVIELRAPDPTWYDPDGASVQFAQTGGGTAMPVPTLFPLTFGASTLDVIQAVALSGDNAWVTYPIIYATGPVTNLVITNTTTGKKLDFTGATIGAGVTYTIDTRYGYKTVVDSSAVNRISQLTADSDIAGWSLQPGNNSLRATGTSVNSATSIVIQYNQRFIGV
jgi:hypothetical protein